MDADEFRRLGHALIDWIADYRENLAQRPVMSQVKPGEIRARFPASPPQEGGHMDEALSALSRDILPGITHWNHPRFFAYFPSNTSYASILGDLASSGLGAQGMSWQTSPAATEVEEVVMDWLRQMLGLSESWTGVIQDTASTATLTALLCARERASEFSQNRKGLQGGEARLVVYASEEAHSSVGKAALLAGFGKEYLRLLPTDAQGALRLDALESALAEDRAASLRPAAILATVGTTATTAIDPVAGIAALAERFGAWLHIDAALAGTAMILPEVRHLWEGVERADSLVLNPHKWMGPGFDLSAYYVRDPQHLIRVMSTNPSYLRTEQDGRVSNFRDWHIQLGRRFRALKLYFYLMDVGTAGITARLRRDLDSARWLKEQIERAPEWEIMAPLTLQTVCFRHAPAALAGDEAALGRHNGDIVRTINESGFAYLTPITRHGQQLLRASIGAERTERADVEALWGELQRVAAKISG
jgi:aromatic-L-amino-acid decarboxylase